jgi:hypothetical protein
VVPLMMSIELMLNGVNITLVAFNHYLQDMRGQILALFIITVAAAEVAVDRQRRRARHHEVVIQVYSITTGKTTCTILNNGSTHIN